MALFDPFGAHFRHVRAFLLVVGLLPWFFGRFWPFLGVFEFLEHLLGILTLILALIWALWSPFRAHLAFEAYSEPI